MSYVQKETAAPASATASVFNQFTSADNSALAYQGQHHPDGPGRTCATCRAGCTIRPDGDARHAFVQCRMLPEFEARSLDYWCMQHSPRILLPPHGGAR